MPASNLGALIGSGIPVVDRSSERGLSLGARKRFEEKIERLQLIPTQGFDGKKIQRPLFRIFEERFADGQVIDEGFPAGGRSCHHDVASGADALDGLGLVVIKRSHAKSKQGRLQDFRKRVRQRAVLSLLSRKNGMVGDFEPLPSALEQHLQE